MEKREQGESKVKQLSDKEHARDICFFRIFFNFILQSSAVHIYCS